MHSLSSIFRLPLFVFLELGGFDGHAGDVDVVQVLKKGFADLIELCDVVTDKFTEARDGFEARRS